LRELRRGDRAPLLRPKCWSDRHAVGGEYGAAYTTVGPGTLKMTFQPASAGSAQITVNERVLKDTVRVRLCGCA
jgi:hypothetical protein